MDDYEYETDVYDMEFEEGVEDDELYGMEFEGEVDEDDPFEEMSLDGEGVIDDVLDGLMDESVEDSEESYEDLFGRRRRRRAAKKRRQKLQRDRARGKAAARARAKASKARQRGRAALMRQIGKNTKSIAAVDKRLSLTTPHVKSNRAAIKGLNRSNAMQTRLIAKNRKTIKLDGAIDLARSVSFTPDAKGTIGVDVDVAAILKGLVKNDVLGKGRGFLASPAGVGAMAFIGQNYQQILGAIGTNTK